MKKSIRLALITGACFLGLAFAAPAFSAYNPSLIMEQSSYKLGGATTADVFIAIDPNADPTAKLTIFSPIGYNANLTAAPGTKIGTRRRAREGEGARRSAAHARRQRARREPGRPGDPGGGDPVHAADAPTHDLGPEHEPAGPDGLDPGLRRPGRAARHPAGLPALARRSARAWAARSSARSSFAADFTIKNVFTNAGTTGGLRVVRASSRRTRPARRRRTRPARSRLAPTSGLPSSLTLKRATAKRGFKLVGQLKIAGVNPRGIKLDLYSGKKAAPAPNAVSGGTGKRIARSAEAPGERQVLDRPAEREVRDLLPDEVRELHDAVHRALALRPAGSVSRRAHRRGHEQPGQGPEAEAQEEAA